MRIQSTWSSAPIWLAVIIGALSASVAFLALLWVFHAAFGRQPNWYGLLVTLLVLVVPVVAVSRLARVHNLAWYKKLVVLSAATVSNFIIWFIATGLLADAMCTGECFS